MLPQNSGIIFENANPPRDRDRVTSGIVRCHVDKVGGTQAILLVYEGSGGKPEAYVPLIVCLLFL